MARNRLEVSLEVGAEDGIRKLRATKTEMKDVRDAANDAERGVDKFGDELTETGRKADGYGRSMNRAGKETDALARVASGAVGRLASMGAAAAGAAAGLAAVGTVRISTDFEREFSQVNTLLDDASFNAGALNDNIAGLKTGLRELRAQSGDSFANLSKGLFDLVSAGVAAEDAIRVLNDANVLAKAGVTDVSVAVDGLTTTINAYGESAQRSEILSAKFFTAQKFGKTTVEELARGLGQVAPLAAQLGVSLDELFASQAAATSAGIRQSEAFTGLKAALTNIVKPAKDAADEADRLGVAFDASALKAKGLTGFLADIQASADFTDESFQKLFGSAEALNFVLAVTGGGAEVYAKTLRELGDETKSVITLNEAYKDAVSTADQANKEFAGSLDQLAVIAGEAGALEAYTGIVRELTEVLRSDAAKDFAANFGGAMKEAADAAAGLLAILRDIQEVTAFAGREGTPVNAALGVIGFLDRATPFGGARAAVGDAFDGLAARGREDRALKSTDVIASDIPDDIAEIVSAIGDADDAARLFQERLEALGEGSVLGGALTAFDGLIGKLSKTQDQAALTAESVETIGEAGKSAATITQALFQDEIARSQQLLAAAKSSIADYERLTREFKIQDEIKKVIDDLTTSGVEFDQKTVEVSVRTIIDTTEAAEALVEAAEGFGKRLDMAADEFARQAQVRSDALSNARDALGGRSAADPIYRSLLETLREDRRELISAIERQAVEQRRALTSDDKDRIAEAEAEQQAIEEAIRNGSREGVAEGLRGLEAVFYGIERAFSQIDYGFAQLQDGLGDLKDNLLKGIGSLASGGANVVSGIGSGLSKIFGDAASGLSSVLGSIGGALGAAGAAASAVATAVSFFKDLFGQRSDFTAQAVFNPVTGQVAGTGQDKGAEANAKARDAFLESALNLTEQLTDLTGGRLANNPATSANEAFLNVAFRNDRKTGDPFIDLGYQGANGEPAGGGRFTDVQEALDAALRLTIGALKDGNDALVSYAKAAAAAGRDSDEIIDGLTALSDIAKLSADPLSDVEQQLKQISDVIDPVREDLKALGLSIAGLDEAAQKANRSVGSNFIDRIQEDVDRLTNATLADFKALLKDQAQDIKDAQTLLSLGAITPDEFRLVGQRNALAQTKFFEGLDQDALNDLGDYLGLIRENGGETAVALLLFNQELDRTKESLTSGLSKMREEADRFFAAAEANFELSSDIRRRLSEETGTEQLATFRAELQGLLIQAQGGDVAAAEKAPEVAQQFIELAERVFQGSAGLGQARDFVTDILDQVGTAAQGFGNERVDAISLAEQQVSLIDDIKELLGAPDPALGVLESILANGELQSATLRDLLDQYVQLAYDSPSQNFTPGQVQQAAQQFVIPSDLKITNTVTTEAPGTALAINNAAAQARQDAETTREIMISQERRLNEMQEAITKLDATLRRA